MQLGTQNMRGLSVLPWYWRQWDIFCMLSRPLLLVEDFAITLETVSICKEQNYDKDLSTPGFDLVPLGSLSQVM